MRHNCATLTGRLILLLGCLVLLGCLMLLGCLVLLGGSAALAQSNVAGNPLRQGQTEREQTDGESLTTAQARLADRYDQLELLAGRLAELSRATQPRRARLLRQLVAKSRERDIAGRFDGIVAALQSESLGKASKSQGQLQVELQQLLELLLQEDRDRQIDSERKRIRKYLAEVKRLIQLQRGIKARTDGGDENSKLTKDQGKLAKSTGKLQQDIRASEGRDAQDAEQGGDSKPADQPPDADDGKPTESKPSDGDPDGAESKAGDAKPGEESTGEPKADNRPASEQGAEPGSDGQPNGESQDSKPSPSGAPSDGPPSPGQSQSQQSPSDDGQSQQKQRPAERAQQRLQRAQQRMQEAIEQLEKAKRDQAVDQQEQALRELEQAKAELERILRQLREEELERMLVLLEARFRKMLDMQVEVYEQTIKLEESQTSAPEHEIEIASSRLARRERQIVRAAERALVLLREDGTTVAFPEAIEQARDDMQSVATRLGKVKIGLITQGLEEDIITALEETLAALQQALEKARERESQRQQQQQSSPGEQPLVDQLAELRMIRALQNRINRRTLRYGEILGDQPALEPDLLEALDDLALRQERVFQATRDLDTGRNQ
ncbi:MAG: hypothetical protein ACR2NM_03430 [Bythopirellula sp.]